MLKDQWIEIVELNSDVLREFIGRYHPINLSSHKDSDITAPNAEQACEVIRKEICKTFVGSPTEQFNVALANNDASTISSLISAAWFGVPESTSCWGIAGFSLAVNLLDDPFEDDEQSLQDNP